MGQKTGQKMEKKMGKKTGKKLRHVVVALLALATLFLGNASCEKRGLLVQHPDARPSDGPGSDVRGGASGGSSGTLTPDASRSTDLASPDAISIGGMGTGGSAIGGAGAGGAGQSAWRQSRDPLCVKTSDYPSFIDVWSDSRGVFALVADDSSPSAIWTNDGTGWKNTFTWPGPLTQTWGELRGFVGGPRVVLGGYPCAVQFVDEQGAHCSSAAPGIADVAVVNANLAYAVYADRLLKFDGSLWTQLGGPLPPAGQVQARAVWADASFIVVVANGGYVYTIRSGQAPALQTELPVVDFTSVWGSASTDVWIGNANGDLYHYDGTHWSLKASLTGDSPAILRLWGSGGSLFVLTRTIFGQWDGTSIKTLFSVPYGDQVTLQGLWGNSATEVFISLLDRRTISSSCGPLQVRWFDGLVVHPL